MNTDDMLDLLESVGEVTPRRMFGGTGFYREGIMFALEAGGRLYLKTDEENRQTFTDAGCEPFVYETKDGSRLSMSYYEPPESAFSSPIKMKAWALQGVQASLRAAKAKTKPKVKARPKGETDAEGKSKIKSRSKSKKAAKKASKKK